MKTKINTCSLFKKNVWIGHNAHISSIGHIAKKNNSFQQQKWNHVHSSRFYLSLIHFYFHFNKKKLDPFFGSFPFLNASSECPMRSWTCIQNRNNCFFLPPPLALSTLFFCFVFDFTSIIANQLKLSKSFSQHSLMKITFSLSSLP